MNEETKLQLLKSSLDLAADEDIKSVPSMNGYYITSHGRVWSTKRVRWIKFVNQKSSPCFSDGNTRKMLRRAVAEAFVPNPNNLRFVIVKDDNHNNCKADNIQWAEHDGRIRAGRKPKNKIIKTTYRFSLKAYKYDVEELNPDTFDIENAQPIFVLTDNKTGKEILISDNSRFVVL